MKKLFSYLSRPDFSYKYMKYECYSTANSKFKHLVIIGHNDKKTEAKEKKTYKGTPPRYMSMKGDEDWTDIWPSARSFDFNSIPLPIHQGFVKNNNYNGFVKPKKYANAELMKIPNFLHLTPMHITKHCKELKRFCTKWPEGLNEAGIRYHFPLEFTQTDYLHSSANIRDIRARVVTLKFELKNLQLNERERYKFLKLLGEKRYDKETDTVTIVGDRCPAHHQNYDYLIYVLTALTNESKKFEKWELEDCDKDWINYQWERSTYRENVKSYCKKANINFETLKNHKEIESKLKNAVEAIYNEKESNKVWDNYKAAVLELMQLNKSNVAEVRN